MHCTYFFEAEMLYGIVDQVSHVLTVLINSGTCLHAEKEVGNLCTFTSYDGCEDTVEILQVYLSQACGNTTVEKNNLGVIHAWILNKNVARVKVSMDKVVNKKLWEEKREEG